MRQKKNREISIFSASAIDLFASSLGVFIVLVVILFPYFNKKSDIKPQDLIKRDIKIKTLEREIEDIQEKQVEVKKVVEQKETLEKEVDVLQKQIEVLEDSDADTAELKKQIVVLNDEIEDLQKKELNTVTAKKQIKELKFELTQTREELKEKTEELDELGATQGSFIAVIVKWSTPKHDLDLVIKDPKGKSFDFKRKSHKSHPGLLSLDSRNGPGAELWQASQIIPGKYNMTFKFYSNYGNIEPAKVKATIFTKVGSIEIPEFTMDFAKMRNKTLTFSAESEGKIKMN